MITMKPKVCVSLIITLACGALQVDAFHKCNKEVIQRIEDYWCGNYPKDILKTVLNNKEEVVVATARSYFFPDVECFHMTYDNEASYKPFVLANRHYQLNNGSQESAVFYLAEAKGSTFDSCTKLRAYYVYMSECQVHGLYLCSEAPDAPEGFPEGLVKMAASNGDSKTKEIEQAKLALCRVGICAIFNYPTQCPSPNITFQ